MSTFAILSSQSVDSAISRRNAGSVEREENKVSFSEVLREKSERKTCPYSNMAKDDQIEYGGVVFVCDYESNSICLGDMSNPKEVLNISLPSGGHLKLNVNNFGDIANAVGMFTPADLAAIMRVISQYNHCVRKVKEADEEEVETVEELADHATEVINGNAEKEVEDGISQETKGDDLIVSGIVGLKNIAKNERVRSI